MAFEALRDRLARVREEIERVQAAEGLSAPVRIIGVTKGHPAEAITAAGAAGLQDIGENRVQEAVAKREALGPAGVRWHLIGHLQTNKAKFVPGTFDMVQSIDSGRLAAAVNRAWGRGQTTEEGRRLPVLLQVNVAGEGQKSGCGVDEAQDLAVEIAALPGLRLEGLMTMAPLTTEERVQRDVFGGLRRLRDRLVAEGLELPELSMGMSSDFRAAVAEGATMIRLGTTLFGERAR